MITLLVMTSQRSDGSLCGLWLFPRKEGSLEEFNLWEFPGGKWDSSRDASLRETLIRELNEELPFDVPHHFKNEWNWKKLESQIFLKSIVKWSDKYFYIFQCAEKEVKDYLFLEKHGRLFLLDQPPSPSQTFPLTATIWQLYKNE
jgi:8-oxo-dGTP pyrophosphatase MutT (NUDIX family)